MTNCIVQWAVQQKRLSISEAELWVVVTPELLTSTTSLRGKLVGPRCVGIETIQIAYPFRMMPTPHGATSLAAKIIVPEPNLWMEETPFLYDGFIELWDRDECADRNNFSIRLKG